VSLRPLDAVLLACCLALAGAVALLAWRWDAFARRWRRLLQAADGRPLEEALARALARLDELDALRGELRRLEERVDGCVRRPAVVRFNAFRDVGADLSFAVALLDAGGTGVVLSGLYARDEQRVYAKPVADGASRYPLTEEERHAIRLSLGGGPTP
jgi:hypothetical protein